MKKIGLVLILAVALTTVKAQDNKTTTTPSTKATITAPSNAAGNVHTPLKVSELPKAIQDDLTKNWAGYSTKNAFKVERNNITTYKLMVAKDTTNMTLLYDHEGKFLTSKVINRKPMAAKSVKPTNPVKANDSGTKKDSIKK